MSAFREQYSNRSLMFVYILKVEVTVLNSSLGVSPVTVTVDHVSISSVSLDGNPSSWMVFIELAPVTALCLFGLMVLNLEVVE